MYVMRVWSPFLYQIIMHTLRISDYASSSVSLRGLDFAGLIRPWAASVGAMKAIVPSMMEDGINSEAGLWDTKIEAEKEDGRYFIT